MKNLKLLLLLLLPLLFSCSDNEKDEPLPGTNDLLKFELRKEHNAVLENTVVAEIDGHFVKLDLPEEVKGELLVAYFEHNGVDILIDRVPQVSGVTKNDFNKKLTYDIGAGDTSYKSYVVEVDWQKAEEEPEPEAKIVIPHIYVDIDNGEPMEKNDKSRELGADLRIEGKEKYEDFEGRTIIRGRGNSTWGMPKQPYRLKLDKKASLMGLPAFKDWVLLNEYLDGSMLYNAIPYKAGQLLGIPYTNTIIPVELTINGEYRGVYAFTEHKEVGEGRIDIGDDGLLLELDEYYDEDWKFKSKNYDLPVMIQFPKSKNMSRDLLVEISKDFNNMESLVAAESFPNNNYLDYFDDESFVNYMIVYQLTLNEELNHPKSTYMNRLAGGKYRMGIIWDFDWAYGFEYHNKHYMTDRANKSIFWTGDKPGTKFFGRIMEDPHMKSLFKERWESFKKDNMDELKEYVEEYAAIVALALERDQKVWGARNGASTDAEINLNRLMQWLELRSNYIDNLVSTY